jgi:hypothetical protein
VTSSCQIRYTASSSGQTLEALCEAEGKHEDMFRGDVSQLLREENSGANWVDMIDSGFVGPMGLNSGVRDLNSSYARALTSLQLTQPELNRSLPSPAEALLSMVACTALDLTGDFPFVPDWVCSFLLSFSYWRSR